MAETKYIFVTGGVASSLGKGIISSSIGKLLQARGYSVTIQKFDPYINIDPGTLNPYEHGECYVTVDGHEADLDLGHYERFLGIQTTKANNITTGRIYKSVIDKERHGDYLGKTIQIIPHITDEIKRNVKLLGNKYKFDFVITEIGGTVGDIESLPYLESIRQLKWELGRNALCVHLTYVPYLAAAGELKTKPTQHSVKELQSVGIQPDILVLRTEHELSTNLKKKVALFCNVDESAVIQSKDMPTIYEVPLRMQEQGLDVTILRKMGLPVGETPTLGPWRDFLDRRYKATEKVKIGLVGKYDLQDAYKSILEALSQAATYNDRKADIHFINSEKLTDENVEESLKDMDGIIICPGFGQRGIEGSVRDSVSAVSKVNSLPSNIAVPTMFRPSVSVWVCSVWPLSLPATYWDIPMPTAVKWMKKLRTMSLTSWKNRNLLPTWVVPCVWVHTNVYSIRSHGLIRHIRTHTFRNVTVTAMNSTTTSRLNLKMPV